MSQTNRTTLSAKTIAGKIPKDMITDAFTSNMAQFFQEKNFDVTLHKSGLFIATGRSKPIKLSNGYITLAKHLEIPEGTIQRIHVVQPTPDTFYQRFFRDGIHSSDLLIQVGLKFQAEYINSVIQKETNKVKNEIVKSKSTIQLYDDGDIGYSHFQLVSTTKHLLDKHQQEENFMAKPLLDGEVQLRFHKWNTELGKHIGEPINVSFYGRPGDYNAKKKHLWVWSQEASWGKSYVVQKEIIDKYRAYCVTDPNNACDVPPNVQILIFDEYAGKHILSLPLLRAVCDGKGFLNRKSHGSSYKTERDVQVIILSNYSPYQVYGEWNKIIQDRIADRTLITTIEDRFQLVMLDGNIEHVRMQWADPEIYSGSFKEMNEYLKHQVRHEIIPKSCPWHAQNYVYVIERIVTLLKKLKMQQTFDHKMVLDLFPSDQNGHAPWCHVLQILTVGRNSMKMKKGIALEKASKELSKYIDDIIERDPSVTGRNATDKIMNYWYKQSDKRMKALLEEDKEPRSQDNTATNDNAWLLSPPMSRVSELPHLSYETKAIIERCINTTGVIALVDYLRSGDISVDDILLYGYDEMCLTSSCVEDFLESPNNGMNYDESLQLFLEDMGKVLFSGTNYEAIQLDHWNTILIHILKHRKGYGRDSGHLSQLLINQLCEDDLSPPTKKQKRNM